MSRRRTTDGEVTMFIFFGVHFSAISDNSPYMVLYATGYLATLGSWPLA